MRRSRDLDGNITYYDGSGLYDFASLLGLKALSAITSDTSKKLAKTAAEKALAKGSEEVGSAVGRKIAKKIDGGKTNELAGAKIVSILQKQNKEPNISQKFNELLLI